MANEEILTDEYVANLLAKDAKESTIKYSALGMDGFASRPPSSKPKPNTRFLRNIIKETDSHNAALLAKEATESRARLEGLVGREKRPTRVSGGDIRKRQLGDIAAILGGGSRKRKKAEEETRPEKRRRAASSPEADQERAGQDRARKRREARDSKEGERESRGYRSHRHRKDRSRSREYGADKEQRRENRPRSRSPRQHRDKESRHRHRSPKRRRSMSPEDRSKVSGRAHGQQRLSPNDAKRIDKDHERSKKKSESRVEEEDSDPLDDIIGPRPPKVPEVKSRGRGTISGASGIDSRFSANYDPKSDVQLDPEEENDWDQALEALRDRQKWKQQGADRLRAAGFTEDEIKKWEKGGEKKEEDVKWAKMGEGREWDRGKVITAEDTISFEPSFGRLKDN